MNLKINFAVCHGKAHGKSAILCRVPIHVAHGKGGIVCRVPDHVAHDKLPTWHAGSTGQLYFAVGPRKHTAIAVCPKKGTWQTPCMPTELCRALFTVCNTRQILCRVFLGLCRVLWHTANPLFSRSDSIHPLMEGWRDELFSKLKSTEVDMKLRTCEPY